MLKIHQIGHSPAEATPGLLGTPLCRAVHELVTPATYRICDLVLSSAASGYIWNLAMQIRSIEALFALLAKCVVSKMSENNRGKGVNKTAVRMTSTVLTLRCTGAMVNGNFGLEAELLFLVRPRLRFMHL